MHRTNQQWGRFLLFLTLCLLLSSTASAVVVFEEYRTVATLTDDGIQIQRDIRIKNTGQTPIIPGELHFRVFRDMGDGQESIEVRDIVAVTKQGQDLIAEAIDRGTETDMKVQLWNPLLPGFHQDFTMQYEMDFSASGFLFHEILLPKEETTIPIVNDELSLAVPSKYKVTYAPGASVEKAAGKTIVVWPANSENRELEYSRVPLPRTGMKAVNLFWSVVIAILVLVFVYSLARRKTGKRSAPTQYHAPIHHAPPHHQPHRQPPRHRGGHG